MSNLLCSNREDHAPHSWGDLEWCPGVNMDDCGESGRGAMADVIFEFLVSEGYHANYLAAEEQAEKLAALLTGESA